MTIFQGPTLNVVWNNVINVGYDGLALEYNGLEVTESQLYPNSWELLLF